MNDISNQTRCALEIKPLYYWLSEVSVSLIARVSYFNTYWTFQTFMLEMLFQTFMLCLISPFGLFGVKAFA